MATSRRSALLAARVLIGLSAVGLLLCISGLLALATRVLLPIFVSVNIENSIVVWIMLFMMVEAYGMSLSRMASINYFLRRDTSSVEQRGRLENLVASLAKKIGLCRLPGCVILEDSPEPAAVVVNPFGKSLLLLDKSFSDIPPAYLSGVIAHELRHISSRTKAIYGLLAPLYRVLGKCVLCAVVMLFIHYIFGTAGDISVWQVVGVLLFAALLFAAYRLALVGLSWLEEIKCDLLAAGDSDSASDYLHTLQLFQLQQEAAKDLVRFVNHMEKFSENQEPKKEDEKLPLPLWPVFLSGLVLITWLRILIGQLPAHPPIAWRTYLL